MQLYLLLGAIALAGLGTIVMLSRSWGKVSEKAARAEEAVDQANEAAEIDDDVNKTPESELDSELGDSVRKR